jgi:hypothetical protein
MTFAEQSPRVRAAAAAQVLRRRLPRRKRRKPLLVRRVLSALRLVLGIRLIRPA